jgi:acetyltransferase-like isoleucine patch superfamily enzyme
VRCSRISMGPRARIRHGTLIKVQSLELAEGASIHHLNRIKGRFDVILGRDAMIGHRNEIIRNSRLSDPAVFRLGKVSGITSKHRLDVTRSIEFGDYSTLAGSGSQIWTHGYIHEEEGAGRYRIDGNIVIEDNVYIGSMSFISMGVRIGKGVIIGGGASVASDLPEAGLYVSSALRKLARPRDPRDRADLVAIVDDPTGDIVFRKRDR